MNYMERRGSGFQKIKEDYHNAINYRLELEPKFHSDVSSFIVTLFNLNYRVPVEKVLIDIEKVAIDEEKVLIDPEKVAIDEGKVLIDPEKVAIGEEKVSIDPQKLSVQKAINTLDAKKK